MKEIFKAIRAMELGALSDPAHEFLRNALHSFERSNRGHQHELDALAAHRGPRLGVTACKAKRLDTLFNSTYGLLQALRTLTREQMPDTPAFEALLTAHDPTGYIEERLLSEFQAILNFRQQHVPEGFGLRGSRCSRQDGARLTVEVTVGKLKTSLTATRQFTLQWPAITTLLQFWTQRRDFEREVKRLLKDIDTWPEFSHGAQVATLKAETLAALEALFKHRPANERQWLAENWMSLRPACLKQPA